MIITELRIGNIVNHTGNDNPHRVDGIKTHNVWFTDIVSHCDYSTEDTKDGIDGLFGELLTKKWLKKLGFEVYSKENGWFKSTWKNSQGQNEIIHVKFFKEELGIYSVFSSWPISPRIKYVHQLQNLFFALTNEELTM